MLECRTIKKQSLSGGELQKIFSDFKRCSGNAYIKLFFDYIASKRLDTLEKMALRNIDEEKTDFYRGYASALHEIPHFFNKLIEEVDRNLKTG